MENKITTKSPIKKVAENKKEKKNIKQEYLQAKANLERKKKYDRIARIAFAVLFLFVLIAFFASLETK
jgi:hypothetical protein